MKKKQLWVSIKNNRYNIKWPPEKKVLLQGAKENLASGKKRKLEHMGAHNWNEDLVFAENIVQGVGQTLQRRQNVQYTKDIMVMKVTVI